MENDSESAESDSDTTSKSARSVSPTPYVPQFPNLPSGLAWYARQKALGNTIPEPTICPKNKLASISMKRMEKDVVPKKEKSVPIRCSTRNKDQTVLSSSAPSGEPTESTFALRRGTLLGHIDHIFIIQMKGMNIYSPYPSSRIADI